MVYTLRFLCLVVVMASLATANYCGYDGHCIRCNGGKPTGHLCTAYNQNVCGISAYCQLVSNDAGLCCYYLRRADPRGVGPAALNPLVSAPLDLAPASQAVNPASLGHGYHHGGKRY